MAGRIDPHMKIPPSWLCCPRTGEAIAGKFIPFKTPLDSRYDDQIPEECRFDMNMLFSSLKTKKIKLGLVIDLTNTSRFYNKEFIEMKYECKYVKLQCIGDGKVPTVEQVRTFVQVCDSFIRRNPLEMIGIHCTHGFNRTGFLIISYLVEKMDWSVDVAAQVFAQSRSPGIYEEDYLIEIFKRFGEEGDTRPAPPLPDWLCSESNDRVSRLYRQRLDQRLAERRRRHEQRRRHEGRRDERRHHEQNKNVVSFKDHMLPTVTQVTIRFGEEGDTRPAPPFPDWCSESDDRDDDGNQVNRMRRRTRLYAQRHHKRQRLAWIEEWTLMLGLV